MENAIEYHQKQLLKRHKVLFKQMYFKCDKEQSQVACITQKLLQELIIEIEELVKD